MTEQQRKAKLTEGLTAAREALDTKAAQLRGANGRERAQTLVSISRLKVKIKAIERQLNGLAEV